MTDIPAPAAQPEHTEDGAAVAQPAAVQVPDVEQGGPYVPQGDGNYQPDGDAYHPGGAEYEAAANAQQADQPADEGHDDERQYNA